MTPKIVQTSLPGDMPQLDISLGKWTHTDKVQGLRKVNTSSTTMPIMAARSMEDLSKISNGKWSHTDK